MFDGDVWGVCGVGVYFDVVVGVLGGGEVGGVGGGAETKQILLFFAAYVQKRQDLLVVVEGYGLLDLVFFVRIYKYKFRYPDLFALAIDSIFQ